MTQNDLLNMSFAQVSEDVSNGPENHRKIINNSRERKQAAELQKYNYQ